MITSTAPIPNLGTFPRGRWRTRPLKIQMRLYRCSRRRSENYNQLDEIGSNVNLIWICNNVLSSCEHSHGIIWKVASSHAEIHVCRVERRARVFEIEKLRFRVNWATKLLMFYDSRKRVTEWPQKIAANSVWSLSGACSVEIIGRPFPIDVKHNTVTTEPWPPPPQDID